MRCFASVQYITVLFTNTHHWINAKQIMPETIKIVSGYTMKINPFSGDIKNFL